MRFYDPSLLAAGGGGSGRAGRDEQKGIVSERLVRIVLPHAVFGLIARDGRIIEAAPIARWTLGKTEAEVAGYYRRKQAECR